MAHITATEEQVFSIFKSTQNALLPRSSVIVAVCKLVTGQHPVAQTYGTVDQAAAKKGLNVTGLLKTLDALVESGILLRLKESVFRQQTGRHTYGLADNHTGYITADALAVLVAQKDTRGRENQAKNLRIKAERQVLLNHDDELQTVLRAMLDDAGL